MSEVQIADRVQEMYACAEGTRSSFQGDLTKAMRYYSDLVQFVSKVAPVQEGANPALQDVGCGCGWSSFAFAQNNYQTTGVDLNEEAFEPPPMSILTLQKASALALPFDDQTFDVVVSYQCVEHLPAPETGLREMLRVCKSGGVVCIVGPNCLSPAAPLKRIATLLARRETLWKRVPGTPRHPYGNTIWENFFSIPVTTGRLISKLVSRKPTFTMRVPDTVPPFHGDNDACYLCNPTDLVKFFSAHGCRLLQTGRHGRLPFSYLVASGTWIAARKGSA